MHGLVVGRFQPLHNGHKTLIQHAIEESVNVTLAIGSSDAKPSLRNPFSFDERRRMVESVFPGVAIVAVPDIHDPPRWVEHCIGLTGQVDVVFGNDDRTMDLFEDAGYRVERPGLERRDEWQAKAIRALLAEEDATWRKVVPAPVVPILDGIEASKRLQRME